MKLHLIIFLVCSILFIPRAFALWTGEVWDFEDFHDNIGSPLGTVSDEWTDGSTPVSIMGAPGGGVAIGHTSSSPFSEAATSYTSFNQLEQNTKYLFQAKYRTYDPGANTLSYDLLNFYSASQKSFSIGITPNGQIGLDTFMDDEFNSGYKWGFIHDGWGYLKLEYKVIDGDSNDEVLISYWNGNEGDPWLICPDGIITLNHDLSLNVLNAMEAYIHPEHTGNSSFIDDISISEIPEPCTIMLLGLGGLLIKKR